MNRFSSPKVVSKSAISLILVLGVIIVIIVAGLITAFYLNGVKLQTGNTVQTSAPSSNTAVSSSFTSSAFYTSQASSSSLSSTSTSGTSSSSTTTISSSSLFSTSTSTISSSLLTTSSLTSQESSSSSSCSPYAIVDNVTFPFQPNGIAYDSDNHYLYVSVFGIGGAHSESAKVSNVTVIDTTTDSIVARIPFPGQIPGAIAFD
ncbi:MAG: YncE family protein, partial [Rhabdochlamydiaceae bacterium]